MESISDVELEGRRRTDPVPEARARMMQDMFSHFPLHLGLENRSARRSAILRIYLSGSDLSGVIATAWPAGAAAVAGAG